MEVIKLKDVGLARIGKEINYENAKRSLERSIFEFRQLGKKLNDGRFNTIADQLVPMEKEFYEKWLKYRGAYDFYHNKTDAGGEG